jgi:transcriptional regulator with PAS, ATPase and Fis domain
MPTASSESNTHGSWASLFHQNTDPVFLLNPRRRLRYINPAFETLTRATAEQVVHEYCHPKKIQKDMPAGRRALLQTLAPPSEVMAGRITQVRRPVPPAKVGPPWWDITFIPLREADKLIGVMGLIVPVGQPTSHAGGRGISESLGALRQEAMKRVPLSLFQGDTPTFHRIHAQAELAAKTFSPLWISGEAGTGKETLARAIHYHGVTRELAFASIDCAGLQPYLIRSLLFGHNGLAETGRVGTIYLKSPESIPADLQAELIEWGELLSDQCRVAVGSGPGSRLTDQFRAAFGVIEIRLPTLVERKAELPRLLAEFLEVEREAGVITKGVSPEAIEFLSGWTWPTNLQEFRTIVRDAARLTNGSQIGVEHLPLAIRRGNVDAKSAASALKPAAEPKLDEVLEQVERRMIELALRRTKGDQTAAAELLGVYRSRLSRRVKALELGE